MSDNEQASDQQNTDNQPVSEGSISWRASEYIHHEKDMRWYGIFAGTMLVVMALMYLILRDVLSLFVVGLGAISVLVFANRPPRVLSYSVTDHGVEIGEAKYKYESFRSFSVVDDHAMQYIVLNPLQRFMPPITIYFEQTDGQKIVDKLSAFLPYADFQPDFVDRFARRIRF